MIIQKLKSTLKKPIGRYVVVGGTVYIIELVVIIVAQAMGAGNLLAVGLSFWIGLLLSFVLQKFITFRDKRKAKKLVMVQFLAVTLLVLWNFGFTLLVTKLLNTRVPVIFSRTFALGITTLWNFYLYRTRIFSSDNSELID